MSKTHLSNIQHVCVTHFYEPFGRDHQDMKGEEDALLQLVLRLSNYCPTNSSYTHAQHFTLTVSFLLKPICVTPRQDQEDKKRKKDK